MVKVSSTINVKQKGFTLIELMLSSALLMMVMFAGYYAYSLYNNKWEKRTDAFWQNTQSALGFDSMNRAIESTYPYIVTSNNKEPTLYYEADETYISFVSHSAIFTKELAIVQLEVVAKNNNKMLVYRESSLENALILKQSQEINWQYQIVLIEQLESAMFSFFGWQNLSQVLKNINRDEEAAFGQEVEEITPQWYSTHQMEKRRILPIKVNIQFSIEYLNSTQL